MIPESTILPSVAIALKYILSPSISTARNALSVSKPLSVSPDVRSMLPNRNVPAPAAHGRARILPRIRISYNLRKIGVSESVRRCMRDNLDVRFIDLADGASHLSPEMPMAESRTTPRVWRRHGRSPYGS